MRIEISDCIFFFFTIQFAFHDVSFFLKMMNSYEQTENMKIFFYNFTFEEEYTKDLKINDVERKANFEFGIF